ncbi:MAG TPA: YhcH/YjgK/YiaL family protein [Tepidisphaeraceae bacterium]|jgi:YhcH/YjgK/YiaL family protein|nr:YhcH/YjgK/YiaL family protein [Tepidisphaeraceae bacterium]
MILDTLQNQHLYRSLPRFDLAFDALLGGISNREDGVYELAGPNIRAIVQRYPTRPLEKCTWEAHRKFIDIQYIDAGVERMGWSLLNQLKSRATYDEAKDVEFFDGDIGQFVNVAAGMFTVFFPTDAHKPCVQVEHASQIVKTVIKIAVI